MLSIKPPGVQAPLAPVLTQGLGDTGKQFADAMSGQKVGGQYWAKFGQRS